MSNTNKPNNPPAFPQINDSKMVPIDRTSELDFGGMTLRDYFAAKAMQAIAAATIPDFDGGQSEWDRATANTAKQAYEIADAMLFERDTNQ